jgi:glycosyltransferase involved in cell wall biosynthesis
LVNIPIAAGKLKKVIRQGEIDLVQSNVGVIPSPALAARWAKVPHVWHVRDWYGEFRAVWSWYRRYILNFSDRVLCVSQAIAAQFPPSPKVKVIHDGFDLEKFAAEPETSRAAFLNNYNVDPNSPVVLCVGRIKWKRKGQEFLVRAGALLRDAGKFFTLIIVGDTSAGNEDHLVRLRALVSELNLNDRVVFTGELSDPRPAYAACDVFVLPSAQPEPFGGVVIEAMCMAKAVVATAIGGSLDQVLDGETGYLVPPADPHALAEKLQWLLDDSALRLRMGKAGFERARNLFTTATMVEKIETIYRELLGQ